MFKETSNVSQRFEKSDNFCKSKTTQQRNSYPFSICARMCAIFQLDSSRVSSWLELALRQDGLSYRRHRGKKQTLISARHGIHFASEATEQRRANASHNSDSKARVSSANDHVTKGKGGTGERRSSLCWHAREGLSLSAASQTSKARHTHRSQREGGSFPACRYFKKEADKGLQVHSYLVCYFLRKIHPHHGTAP